MKLIVRGVWRRHRMQEDMKYNFNIDCKRRSMASAYCKCINGVGGIIFKRVWPKCPCHIRNLGMRASECGNGGGYGLHTCQNSRRQEQQIIS